MKTYSLEPSGAANGWLGLGWRPKNVGVGLVAWLMAVGAALLAQYELTPVGAVERGVGLYVAAAVLLLFASHQIDRASPLADSLEHSEPISRSARNTASRGSVIARIVIASGIIAVIAASFSLVTTSSSSLAVVLWLLGLVSIFLGTCLWTGARWSARLTRDQLVESVGVLALMGLAFALRFPNLTVIPTDVHGDEAAVGIAARAILSGEVTNIFGLGWASLPELSFVPSALSMRLFGNDLFGLRMASVIQGCLSVGLLYGVTKRLFSVRVAALAAIVLAVSQMSIHYGRTGINYVGALFASLLLVYFLLRGLSTRKPVEFLLAGFATGFALSVYYSARLTIALAALYLLHRAIGERGFIRQQWRGLVVLAVGAALFFSPQAVWYARDPLSALNRTSGVFLFSPDNLAHEFAAYHVHTVPAVLEHQVVNSIDAFNLRGETSLQYGQSAPLLDFWSGALFVLGVAVVTARLRHARYFLLASWLWLTLLLGSVLTIDALFSPRMVAIIGIIAVLPALIIEMGWRGMEATFGARGGRIAVTVVAVFMVVVARLNYIDYFDVHVRTMEPANFFTVLSRYVETVNDQYRIYLLADRDTSLRYDTAHFLIPHVDGVDVRNLPLPTPLDRVPSQKGVIFVDPSDKDPRFAAIRAQYPRGVLEIHRSTNGAPQFYSYRVEHADLIAANPKAVVDHAPIPGLEVDKLPAVR